MRRVSAVAWVCLCLLAGQGCQRAADVEPAEQEKRNEAQEIRSKLDETLKALRALETERRAAELGVPTAEEILTDLGAVSALLAEARARINAEQPKDGADLLLRARDVLSFTSSRLPRAQMVMRLARAVAALPAKQQGRSGSGDGGWDTVRRHVEEAGRVGEGARSRPMRVEVDGDLTKILEAIDESDAEQVRTAIAQLLQTKLAPSEGEVLLGHADWCINAAIEALGRNGLSAAAAWVADAERAVGKVMSGLGGTALSEPEAAAAKPEGNGGAPSPTPEEAAGEEASVPDEASEEPAADDGEQDSASEEEEGEVDDAQETDEGGGDTGA